MVVLESLIGFQQRKYNLVGESIELAQHCAPSLSRWNFSPLVSADNSV